MLIPNGTNVTYSLVRNLTTVASDTKTVNSGAANFTLNNSRALGDSRDSLVLTIPGFPTPGGIPGFPFPIPT